MTIREIIYGGKMVSEVRAVRRCSAVNIGFVNKHGRKDETQLDVLHSLRTRAGEDELCHLWESVCDEFDALPDMVTSLTIVGSASNYDELILMGY